MTDIIQATSVSINNRAILILGDPGVGKTSLALRLIEGGAILISDDVTCIDRRGDVLYALPPDTIAGCVEVRGVGILKHISYLNEAPIIAVIHLTPQETPRLPDPVYRDISGVSVRRFSLTTSPNNDIQVRMILKLLQEEKELE